MRAIGLDVHRDFCEVAVVEDGVVRSAGRVAGTPAALELLAASLSATDKVALEVTRGRVGERVGATACAGPGATA